MQCSITRTSMRNWRPTMLLHFNASRNAASGGMLVGLILERNPVAPLHVLGRCHPLPVTTYAPKHARPYGPYNSRHITGSYEPINQQILTSVEVVRYWLQEYGLEKWGFVIYRCTYEDDDAWERFMKMLKHRVRDFLEEWNGLDLEHGLEWTVCDDRVDLDGASIDCVRERFKVWKETDGRAEQRAGEFPINSMPRYHYCLHVDEAALQSVALDSFAGSQRDWKYLHGYLNLISSAWEADPEEEADETDTEIDLGYVRVSADGVLPGAYSFLQSPNGYRLANRTRAISEIWDGG